MFMRGIVERLLEEAGEWNLERRQSADLQAACRDTPGLM